MRPIKLAVVDDHPLFREGVIRSLAECSEFCVVGEGSNGNDAVGLATTYEPDIMLLDLSMPGGGVEAIEAVRHAGSKIRIIVLTASEDPDTLSEALKRGISGYVLKGVGSRHLAEAIRSVASGERYIAPTLSARLIAYISSPQTSLSKPDLTQRERDVLDLVSQGLSNKMIAIRLDLQEKTVKHHMTAILSKLGVSNRTEAALAWRDVNDLRPVGEGGQHRPA